MKPASAGPEVPIPIAVPLRRLNQRARSTAQDTLWEVPLAPMEAKKKKM